MDVKFSIQEEALKGLKRIECGFISSLCFSELENGDLNKTLEIKFFSGEHIIGLVKSPLRNFINKLQEKLDIDKENYHLRFSDSQMVYLLDFFEENNNSGKAIITRKVMELTEAY